MIPEQHTVVVRGLINEQPMQKISSFSYWGLAYLHMPCCSYHTECYKKPVKVLTLNTYDLIFFWNQNFDT